MKAGWQVRKFGEVCELKKGKKPALSVAPANGYKPYLVAKYLRGAEPVEFASVSDKNSISVGKREIIIICDGSNSGETFIGFDGILSSTMAKVVHGVELDNKFLMHFLDSLFEQFNAGKTGSAIPHLDLSALRAQNLPVPPLAEQQRIVGILDDALDGISTAKANAEQNLQNARALFESHLQSVFTQRGDGWVVKRLDDACDLITCGVAAKPKYVDVGVPFLSAKNVKRGEIVWSGYNSVSKKTHDELTKNNKPLKGDILYTRVGSYGEAAVIEEDIEFSVFVSLTLIKPIKNLLNNYYLKYYLNSSEVKELAKRSISSSGVGNLNVGTVREFPIHLPSLTVQAAIVAKLDEISNETQRLESLYQLKLAALAELKKSLLHQAFSGAL